MLYISSPLPYCTYYSQPVRQAVLTVWKYCFEGRVPPVLTSSSSAADGRVADRIFGSVLPMDRLTVRNPNDEAQKMENVSINSVIDSLVITTSRDLNYYNYIFLFFSI